MINQRLNGINNNNSNNNNNNNNNNNFQIKRNFSIKKMIPFNIGKKRNMRNISLQYRVGYRWV